MQVQAVNNKTSFGAIYQPIDFNFNKFQEPIADAIKKAMREPLHKFNGKTAEGFYKSKGLDFEIAPHSSESVYLTAYKGMKEIGRGVDREHTYSDFINIGEYDKNSEFRISDIESAIKDKKVSDFGFGLIFAALIGLISVLGLGNRISRLSNSKMQETTKPLIENVDSIANKAKAIQPILEDSFKFGKKIIIK